MKIKDLLNIFFRKDIPHKNLKLMESIKKGGMLYLLRRESMGGNAGSYKNYNCVGARFEFNIITGEITKFTNYAKDNTREGIFRLLVFPTDIELMERFNVKNLFFKIIDYSINKCSTIAKENIYRTITLWNDKYKIKGFEI